MNDLTREILQERLETYSRELNHARVLLQREQKNFDRYRVEQERFIERIIARIAELREDLGHEDPVDPVSGSESGSADDDEVVDLGQVGSL